MVAAHENENVNENGNGDESERMRDAPPSRARENSAVEVLSMLTKALRDSGEDRKRTKKRTTMTWERAGAPLS